MHIVERNDIAWAPEEGFLLGNGDLSVSIYQKAGQIIWRFGKNDVWDRRLDLSDGVKPAHIDEITRGVKEEGWISHSYVKAEAEAKRSVKDVKRMNEICDGYPAYAFRPYPCPKPVGELVAHLPLDQRGFKISQRLLIEKGEVEITCSYDGGAVIKYNCFVAPTPNVLGIRWEVKNWNDQTRSKGYSPVWFTLYRWADPTVDEHASQQHIRGGYWYFGASVRSGKCTPLPPPKTSEIGGCKVIEQNFYPDLEYKDGFRYALAPWASNMDVEPTKLADKCKDAAIHIRKKHEDVLNGWLGVAVATSQSESTANRGSAIRQIVSAEDGVESELKRISNQLKSNTAKQLEKLQQTSRASAKEFWSKSAVRIDDPLLENIWYELLHARRCAFRAGVVAPGLAFPSTVQDYSLWHGDYHTNYNYQMGFWGDYTSNHIDIGDSFFPGMNHMVEIGRKMARDYWNCRGTFIQVTGYPFPIEDDPYGTCGLCRMAYMTGWISNHYWWRYLYTQDKEWLKTEGYPVIKDCALFYLDFLKKWADGKYHAFPSGSGEYFFTGKPKDYTDKRQVVRHARYCLQSAIHASEALGIDDDLRAQWQDRLDNLVVVDDLDKLGFSEEQKRRHALNPPELAGQEDEKLRRPGTGQPEYLKRIGHRIHGTIEFNWHFMNYVRNNFVTADKMYQTLRRCIQHNRVENGTMIGMSLQSYRYIGLYGEATGFLAPLQEMMLQSWDGNIRVFPVWPKKIKASFSTLRAEDAFLVSAEHKNGRVTSLSLISEAGQPCRVVNPFRGKAKVVDRNDKTVKIRIESGNPVVAPHQRSDSGVPSHTRGRYHILCFNTKPGGKYKVRPA